MQLASTLDGADPFALADPPCEEAPLVSRPFCTAARREHTCILTAYLVFFAALRVGFQTLSDGDFSAVLTASSAVQCFGFLLLLFKVRSQETVAGLSSRTLEMYTLVFLFRLSSTLVKNGYIPVDRSGDWAYQAGDAVSLLAVCQLLYCVQVTHKHTYQLELDTLDIWTYLVPACVLLAVFVHGDLDASPLFDIAWTISLYVDTFALLPQLVMLFKIGGAVDGLNCHFVACISVSKAFAFWFWYEGWPELAPLDGGPNITGWTIIGSHTIMLLLSGDFMVKYALAQYRSARKVIAVLDEK